MKNSTSTTPAVYIKGSGIRNALRDNFIAYTMILPAMFFFFLFLVYPVLKAFQISMYEYSGIGNLEKFIGLENYIQSFGDKEFLFSILNTFKLLILDLILSIIVGFLFAYFLLKRFKGWKFFSVALYIPAIAPITVAGLIWRQIYEPNQGLLNSLLHTIGLDGIRQIWIGDMDIAMNSVVIAWVWRVIPFVMLILYSSMLHIPEELFESARIDGAKEINIIKNIVLPYIAPTISILIIYIIATDFRAFDMLWVLTQGGPGNSTQIATVYVYKLGSALYEYGYANAVGTEIFLFIGGIVFTLASILKKLGFND